MKKFVLLFGFAGLVIPLVYSGLWHFINLRHQHHFKFELYLENSQLLAWPSSIFMLPTEGYKATDYKMLSISIITNVLLYMAVGLIIWFGIKKYQWLLYALAMLIALGWYKLLKL